MARWFAQDLWEFDSPGISQNNLKKTKKEKAEKQVINGYHPPVCIKCHCELRPEKNGVGVLDMNDNGPYELYVADLWKCPRCGLEVVGGFALNPISAHYEPDFKKMIEHYKKDRNLIENSG